jgi:hypothetical protein
MSMTGLQRNGLHPIVTGPGAGEGATGSSGRIGIAGWRSAEGADRTGPKGRGGQKASAGEIDRAEDPRCNCLFTLPYLAADLCVGCSW